MFVFQSKPCHTGEAIPHSHMELCVWSYIQIYIFESNILQGNIFVLVGVNTNYTSLKYSIQDVHYS